MATYRSIITNAGASLLSYQLAHGGSVNIYRAAAGNGIPSGDPRQLTTLVSEQPSLNIDLGAKQFIDGNPSVVIIPVQINNAGITVPTAIREIGLFAEDPNGEEILFAYSYIDGADTDNILPPPQVTNPEQQFDTVHTHDIILFITSDENAVISVTYTPSNFVSQSQLDAHKADYANPHHVKAEQVFALGGVPAGTTFPTSPAPYTLFFRTDLNKLFVYLP